MWEALNGPLLLTGISPALRGQLATFNFLAAFKPCAEREQKPRKKEFCNQPKRQPQPLLLNSGGGMARQNFRNGRLFTALTYITYKTYKSHNER